MKYISPIIILFLCAVSFKANGQQNDSTDTEYKVFEKVDIEAGFPGGERAWRNFLERNLKPGVPVENGAPAGVYTVLVQFIVDKDGTVTDIKALTNWGYGMESEVIRIIKKTDKWTPAWQNGRTVKAYRKQPVSFVIQEDGLEVKVKNDVLYIRTDNLVTINADKVKDENLHVAISQGTISGNGGSYIVHVNTTGRAIIDVYNKRKKIGSASFEVKLLPQPNRSKQ